MAEKTVSIKLVVDEVSARKAQNTIRELISDAQKLVETFSRVQLGLGGAGGLGAAPFQVSTTPGAAPTAGFQAAQQTARLGGGVTDSLLRLGQSLISVFKGGSDGVKGSFSTIRSELQATAQAARAPLDQMGVGVQRLTDDVRNLVKELAAVKDTMGSLPGQAPAAMRGAARAPIEAPSLQELVAETTRSIAIRGRGGPPRPGAGDYTTLPNEPFLAPPGAAAAAGGGGRGAGGGRGGAGGGVGAFLEEKLPFGVGAAVARYGIPLGVGYAAYKAYDWGSEALKSNALANTEEALRQPMYGIEKSARTGAAIGGLGAQVLFGRDAARAGALMSLRKDPNFIKDMADVVQWQRREEVAAKRAGLPTFDSQFTGKTTAPGGAVGVKQVATRVKQKMGQFLGTLGQPLSPEAMEMLTLDESAPGGFFQAAKAPPARTHSRQAEPKTIEESTRLPQDIDFERSLRNMGPEAAERFKKWVDLKVQENPLQTALMERMTSDAFGRMAMMRAGRISGEVVARKGGPPMSDLDRLKVQAEAAGYDVSEYVGARAAVRSAAGERFVGYGPRLLGMQQGGLYNVNEMFGTMAQFGGPLARGRLPPALEALQRSIGMGQGGLEIAAGRQLANPVMQQLMGGFGPGPGDVGQFTGAESIRALTSAAYTPAIKPGEITSGMEQRQARILTEGMGATGRLFGGKTDNLHQALMYMAARRAAPNAGSYAWQAMQDMTPAAMLEVMRTGNVPDEMKRMGLEKGDLQSFIQQGFSSARVGVMSKQFKPGSAIAKTMQGFSEAGGDAPAFVRHLLKERNFDIDRMDELAGKGKRSARENKELAHMRRQAQDIYRPELRSVGSILGRNLGMTVDEAEGLLEVQVAGDKGLSPELVGGGATSGVSRKARERGIGAGISEASQREGELRGGGMGKDVVAAAQAMAKVSIELQAMLKNVTAGDRGGANVAAMQASWENALTGFTRALQAHTEKIGRVTSLIKVGP